MQHPSEDDLALVALGESVDQVDEHVRDCAECASEVLALSFTARTARDADVTALTAPPASVWEQIANELGLAEQAPSAPTQPARPLLSRHSLSARRSLRGRVLAGAVSLAVAATAVGLVATLVGGRPTAPVEPPRPDRSSVPLVALGTTQASGQVTLSAGGDRRALQVATSGLPRPEGFYEVWLLDGPRNRLVALGALDDSGRGWLTIPDGVSLSDYPQVDISLEPDDGNPGHSGDSVLRADLPA